MIYINDFSNIADHLFTKYVNKIPISGQAEICFGNVKLNPTDIIKIDVYALFDERGSL